MSRKGDGQLVITSGSSVSSELMFLVKWLKSGLRVLCRCACETRQIDTCRFATISHPQKPEPAAFGHCCSAGNRALFECCFAGNEGKR